MNYPSGGVARHMSLRDTNPNIEPVPHNKMPYRADKLKSCCVRRTRGAQRPQTGNSLPGNYARCIGNSDRNPIRLSLFRSLLHDRCGFLLLREQHIREFHMFVRLLQRQRNLPVQFINNALPARLICRGELVYNWKFERGLSPSL
jgi:hypothetical protein